MQNLYLVTKNNYGITSQPSDWLVVREDELAQYATGYNIFRIERLEKVRVEVTIT